MLLPYIRRRSRQLDHDRRVARVSISHLFQVGACPFPRSYVLREEMFLPFRYARALRYGYKSRFYDVKKKEDKRKHFDLLVIYSYILLIKSYKHHLVGTENCT